MFIAIRKEPNGLLYIDKFIYSRTQEVQDEKGNITIQPLFTDEQLSKPPYNYTKVEIDDKYSDCESADFNDDLTFSVEKYNARKTKELEQRELVELQTELNSLSQDMVQAYVGAIIPEEKKERFMVVHNRIRELQGKEPRVYNNVE